MVYKFGEIFFDQEFAWSEKDDKDYGLGAGFRYFKLPFRAALREVTLKAMLQIIESAFPKTFTAVSTEGTQVEDSATFFEERKAEIVMFVQEFRATLMRNSAERVWKPTVLWGSLAEPSVEKNVADAILTHVFQQEPDAAFQPSKLSDPLEQEAWDLLKEKIKSKSAGRGWRPSVRLGDRRQSRIVSVKLTRSRRRWMPISGIGARSNERWTRRSSQRQRLRRRS